MTSVIRNPAIRTYTYAPGKAPAGKKAQEIALKPGQTLAFQPGAGYYAKPAVRSAPTNPYAPPVRPQTTPTTPPASPAAPPTDPYAAWSPGALDARATQIARAQLTPQQDEIRRQQDLARQQAEADYSKIQGLSGAAAELMAKLGPESQAAYERAAATEGSLGQGLATGVQQDVASRVAADKSFIESQGQSGGSTLNIPALHDVVFDINGRIPGDTFAEQGATAAQWGLAQAPIALNAGRAQMDARMAQARQENDQYAQQLIQLAAQFPDLKANALQQLNQYELDKANYRLNVMQTKAQIASQNKQDALAARSERAQEKAAGLTATIRKDEMKYRWASLKFQSQKAMAAAKAASAKGKTIDVQASKLLGHIVYKDGSEDPSIKVAKDKPAGSTAGQITQAAKVRARMSANKDAYTTASKLLGDPVKAKGGKGTYVARTSGVPNSATFPPAFPGGPRTTNNPKYAQRQGGASGWQDAFQKTWAAIDGDTLIASYGYTREQVTSWITAALRRAGWKRK